MGISSELLKTKSLIRQLSPISDKMEEVSEYLESLKELVEQEIFTQDEVDELSSQYKETVKYVVDEKIQEESAKADDIEETSVLEANDKVKNITPIIQGTPVIIPIPTSYQQNNLQTLSQLPSLTSDLSNITNNINRILG